MRACLATLSTPVAEESFEDSRFLSPVSLRQCGGIYAKGLQRSRFLNTELNLNPHLSCLTLWIFFPFKVTFLTVYKTLPCMTPPVSGFPQASVSYLRHPVVNILLLSGSVSLFTCSPLKRYCKHFHLETHTSVPQIFCQDLNSFHMPNALCPYNFSWPPTLLPSARISSSSYLSHS